jgi:hypothetical protein
MSEDIKQIIVGFFKSLKCEISETSNSLIIKKIPEKVWKVFGISENIEVNFVNNGYGLFMDSHSDLYRKIKDYLKTNPSKTLLKIDFEFPSNIKERIPLRNCSVAKIEKKHENNYFSRFTILTTFRYLSKIEQVLNEIYVHEGKVVQGDLKDYDVKEGQVEEVSTDHLAADYDVAKHILHDLTNKKVEEISIELDDELNKEILRIEEHYSSILGEFNLNKSRLTERIKEAGLSGEEEKLKKLNEIFENNFCEREFQKILKEKQVLIDNEKMKFSLDVENKLINTTIIYYPVFKIFLSLDEAGFKKTLEVFLNPLTQEITNFSCDSCNTLLDQINVCHGGHICCGSCLHVCSECGKRFCRLCIAGICNGCGKLVCKNCARECGDCKKLFCKNCMRTSSITGKEKCTHCVTYCPKCSRIVENSNLTRDSSGAMVCKSCGGSHRRIINSSSEVPIRKITGREIFGE